MEETEPSVELIINSKKKLERLNATKPAVVVRNFVNNMNDYRVAGRGSDEAVAQSQQVPLTHDTAPRVALWVPPEFLEHSFPHSSAFLKAAIKLKDEVRTYVNVVKLPEFHHSGTFQLARPETEIYTV